MADPRVYPSENRPAYQVDYSDTSGEMPRGGGQTRYNYSSGSSGEMPRQPDPKPPKHHVVQIPKDQVFRTPPPENARLQKIYAARAKNKRNRNCFCFLRYLLSIILTIVILVLLAAGVFFVLFRPKIPKYTLNSLTVNNFNVSTPNTLTFSPEFEATVVADNPNSKITVYYEDGSDITMSYKGDHLAHGAWPKFHQPENNITQLVILVKGSGIHLSQSLHDEILQNERSAAVPLHLDMKVPVKIQAGSMTTWPFNVLVSCDVTLDKLAAAATIVDKSCHVKVHVFNKF